MGKCDHLSFGEHKVSEQNPVSCFGFPEWEELYARAYRAYEEWMNEKPSNKNSIEEQKDTETKYTLSRMTKADVFAPFVEEALILSKRYPLSLEQKIDFDQKVFGVHFSIFDRSSHGFPAIGTTFYAENVDRKLREYFVIDHGLLTHCLAINESKIINMTKYLIRLIMISEKMYNTHSETINNFITVHNAIANVYETIHNIINQSLD